MSIFFLLFIIFLIINNSFCLKFENVIKKSTFAKEHGYFIGYFTFTDNGIAGLSYKVSNLLNSTNLILHIFPMANDPFTNLQRMREQYSAVRCRGYYKKSIYSIQMNEDNKRLSMGRFSGGFSVAIIISNMYSCLEVATTFSQIEESPMVIEVNVFNPDEKGDYNNHLSGPDIGMKEIIRIFLIFFGVTLLLAIYSMKWGTNNNVAIMVIIQRVVAFVIVCHIIICLLLSSAYTSLRETGQMTLTTSLAAEMLALLCRYLQLYVVVAWTLSSPNDSCRRATVVAKATALCASLHLSLTPLHYLLVHGRTSSATIGCSSVWDCEPHVFTAGWGNPVHYEQSVFGCGAALLNLGASLAASLFVLHLLKVGLRTVQSTVRRAYLSVFCSVALLWFWAYAGVWLLSTLVVDYWQYKTVIFLVTLCNLSGIIAILRVTRISPVQIDCSSPTGIIVY